MSNQDKLKVALKDFTWLSVMDIAWVYEVGREPVQDGDNMPTYPVEVSLTVTLASGQWVCIKALPVCTDLNNVIGTITGFNDYSVVTSSDRLHRWLNLEAIGEAMFEYLKEYASEAAKNIGDRTEVVYY